jgi:hypothetical protein
VRGEHLEVEVWRSFCLGFSEVCWTRHTSHDIKREITPLTIPEHPYSNLLHWYLPPFRRIP